MLGSAYAPHIIHTQHVPFFFFADAAWGTRVALTVEVEFSTANAAVRTVSVTQGITRIAPFLTPPTRLGAGAEVTVHAGDLHVHTCHGEALGACAPAQREIAKHPRTSWLPPNRC